MDPADFTASFTRSPPAGGLCKGEPSHTQYSWQSIPRTRLIGNMLLSFLTRFATGYWTVGDAQTGYTARSAR